MFCHWTMMIGNSKMVKQQFLQKTSARWSHDVDFWVILGWSHDMNFCSPFAVLPRANPLQTLLQQKAERTLTSGMSWPVDSLNAGARTRAFEVVDPDITNTASFVTKGLGSTTGKWIKQNADERFRDTGCVKQAGQKHVCPVKDLLTPTDIWATEQSRAMLLLPWLQLLHRSWTAAGSQLQDFELELFPK